MEAKRLNKFIADSGYCSRREADRLIAEGRVRVDGRVGALGDQVQPGVRVEVDGKPLSGRGERVYLALNKPAGIVCTTDPRERYNVVSYLNYPIRIFPVGRLDRESEGLLLLTSDGRKMGKTEAGALWLDPNKTSPYDFYQYWRNVDDADVEKCLSLLTFLPMDEVRRLGALEGAEINQAKRVLAFEVTKLVHGEDEAQKAQDAADALFSGGGRAGSTPTTSVTREELAADSRLISLAVKCGLCKSNGDARKTIQAGGLYIGDEKVADVDFTVTPDMLEGEGLLLRKGKKNYHLLVLAQ